VVGDGRRGFGSCAFFLWGANTYIIFKLGSSAGSAGRRASVGGVGRCTGALGGVVGGFWAVFGLNLGVFGRLKG